MQLKAIVALPLVVWLAAACGSDAGASLPDVGTGGGTAAGGKASGVGGNGAATGGAASSGGARATGGSIASTGGTQATGGTRSNTGGTTAATGGSRASGGTAPTTGGTSTITGGSSPSTGGTTLSTGGISSTGGTNATGGTSPSGGNRSGGTSSGGTATGGMSTGGASSGGTGTGTATGGTGTGGRATGGASTGGTASGGRATGGTASGGTASGGTATGGTAPTNTGGTGACDWSDPPSNVSAWINESWNDQLGANTRNREAWLLDSVMLGKGQINLCVRWGATSAPSASVKSGMASAVQKWFNDWFATLNGYGCFPYPTITAKVTGWAVKPGNTSWVSDLGSDVRVYTETDGEGEPKCSDSCSFFTNWSHSFPNCEGGEAFHHDYWLWLDDSIGGGAAAVGGDWGLRMPVSNFTSSMGKSNLVIEHEMGHGFGFQDYYEWTGSTPAGGSLMIVGSTSSQSPTTADMWLLRRDWKEAKALRGW